MKRRPSLERKYLLRRNKVRRFSKNLKSSDFHYIKGSRVARLATVNNDGSAHIVPLVIASDKKNLYFTVDKKPKKNLTLKRIENIRRTRKATILFDHYYENWKRLSYVLMYCDARILESENSSERKRALKLLKRKYKQYRIGNYFFPDPIVVRLIPSRIRRWNANSARESSLI